METEEQIYRDLQERLNKLPISYPRTESGVEIRILKHLFTPKEAKIAVHLSMLPETIKRIYSRVKDSGITIEELQEILDRMVHKGNILGTRGGGEKRYRLAMLAIGMYEFQVDRMDKEFARDWLQYLDEAFAPKEHENIIPQIRTIPVEKSIPLPEKHIVSNYDDVRYLVKKADGQIAVANCICRQAKDLVGESCTTTDLRETCIILPNESEYFIGVGIGRAVTKQEALNILEKAQEAGLVLQPLNSQRPEAICTCCGDCCGILTAVKKTPRPADRYATNYYAEINPELCTGCQTCIERCQLEAAVMVNGTAAVNLDRCIGCGNCVVTCESNAIQMKKKEKETVPPKDSQAAYMKILSAKTGKWNMIKLVARLLTRQKV